MPNLTAQLTLDLSAAQTQWTATKNAAKALPDLVQAVQATLAGITVAGTPATGGTFTFVISDANTTAALNNLRTAVQTLLDDVVATQAALDVSVPIVVQVV